MNTFDELYDQLRAVIPFDEIGFHAIKNGRLNPVHKSNITDFKLVEWKAFHAKNPVYIENDPLLTQLVNLKELIAIQDTNAMDRKPEPFEKLDIRSVYIFPVINKDEVVGFVEIPGIKKYLNYSEDDLAKCQSIVSMNKEFLIQQSN
ncbi:GAF domain-containing protein [Vallitalea okinawensis]|uniref:GAF domain-containing protein n=1 Tax=Vallitalea okinawensis TaxID=2078660 RepID=UPI000CFD68AF|nr:GAF domain-containing protein [Vallitalea okinawensis]